MNFQLMREECDARFVNKVEFLELQKKNSSLEIQFAIANDKIIRLQASENNLEEKLNILKNKLNKLNNSQILSKIEDNHYTIDT